MMTMWLQERLNRPRASSCTEDNISDLRTRFRLRREVEPVLPRQATTASLAKPSAEVLPSVARGRCPCACYAKAMMGDVCNRR